MSRSRRCSVKWAVKYLDIQRGGIGMEEERKEGRKEGTVDRAAKGDARLLNK